MENVNDASEVSAEQAEREQHETGGAASAEVQRETEREGEREAFDDGDDHAELTDETMDESSVKDEAEEEEEEETAEKNEGEYSQEAKPVSEAPEPHKADTEKSTAEKPSQMTEEEKEALKDKLREDIETMKSNPSGYTAWEKGDQTYQNRSEAKLSSKNFDRLMEERGVDDKTAADIKESFEGEMKVSHGYEGDRYTMMYGDKKASGNYLADQSAREMNANERQDKYALPPTNDASHIREVQLSRDQFVISGEVKGQPDFEKQAGDGVNRDGGATQYVTDGGYKNGAVSDAYQSIDTVKEKMSEAEQSVYEKSDTHKGEVNGREALIRNDINYDQVDGKGRTNLERMEAGLAPLDANGKSIELHHMGQKMDAPLAELNRDEHRGQGADQILHDKNAKTDIIRNDFSKERSEYWQARAAQIRNERGETS